MTLEESKQIHYIIKEIGVLQKELAELRMKNPYKQNIVTDMPRGGRSCSDLSDYANEVMELEDMLNYSLRKLQRERKKFEQFLTTVDNSEMRLILRLRCINNMGWFDIGTELNMDRRTASRKFYKFFKEQKDARNARGSVIK